LKKSLYWWLLLLCVALLYIIHQGGYTLSANENGSKPTVNKFLGAAHQYKLSTAWPGNVSAADNRISHQQTSQGSERSENDDKRRQQAIYIVLSCAVFASAYSFAQNSHRSSRRQPQFYSIITENRQFRL
jgi:hypothetical protein